VLSQTPNYAQKDIRALDQFGCQSLLPALAILLEGTDAKGILGDAKLATELSSALGRRRTEERQVNAQRNADHPILRYAPGHEPALHDLTRRHNPRRNMRVFDKQLRASGQVGKRRGTVTVKDGDHYGIEMVAARAQTAEKRPQLTIV
jgi:hypothetical protein